MEEKGCRHVEMAGMDDKRQTTAVSMEFHQIGMLLVLVTIGRMKRK